MTMYHVDETIGYKCCCANRAQFVDVNDADKSATFYCGDCLHLAIPAGYDDVEIKTITWLGSCPPYSAHPPQIRLPLSTRHWPCEICGQPGGQVIQRLRLVGPPEKYSSPPEVLCDKHRSPEYQIMRTVDGKVFALHEPTGTIEKGSPQ